MNTSAFRLADTFEDNRRPEFALHSHLYLHSEDALQEQLEQRVDFETIFVRVVLGGTEARSPRSSWFAYEDVEHWATKWTEPDANGQRSLLEIIHEYPLCGEVPSDVPNESVFRGIRLGKS